MIEDNCETFVSDCHVRTVVELISHAGTRSPSRRCAVVQPAAAFYCNESVQSATRS